MRGSAAVQEEGRRPAVLPRDDEVGPTVAVEIADPQTDARVARVIDERGAEPPVTVGEQHRHADAADGNIGLAVAVEVSDRDRPGSDPRSIL